MIVKFISMIFIILIVSACTQVNYVEERAENSQFLFEKKTFLIKEKIDGNDEDSEEPIGLFYRNVNYKIADSFYRNSPRCVMIAPLLAGQMRKEMILLIENTIARHAGQRIEKVIGAGQVYKNMRTRALDISKPKHLRRLARDLRCGAIIMLETTGAEGSYAVVFAQLKFALKVTMKRIKDNLILWQGAHQASRSGGGVPFGLISIPVKAIQAGRFSNDEDVLPSLVDDVARRIFASLPNMRIER
jgi:hypothetical protein